jgi:hypothetical protein
MPPVSPVSSRPARPGYRDNAGQRDNPTINVCPGGFFNCLPQARGHSQHFGSRAPDGPSAGFIQDRQQLCVCSHRIALFHSRPVSKVQCSALDQTIRRGQLKPVRHYKVAGSKLQPAALQSNVTSADNHLADATATGAFLASCTRGAPVWRWGSNCPLGTSKSPGLTLSGDVACSWHDHSQNRAPRWSLSD